MTVTQKAQTAPHNRLRTEARKRLPRARGAVQLSRPKTSVSGPAFSLPRISDFTAVTFHFKWKSIFRSANMHKRCIHSPKCYTNITGPFCPQQGERGCLSTFCSNRNKQGKGSGKGRRK